MPPPPPPALPDELLEEILLRLPPEDPGCLFRASLVCKPWRSRLTGSAFSRLYREFHGTPPLLGFFENDETVFCWFAPLCPTSPFLPVHPDHRNLFALDSRHGLVLLNTVGPDGEHLDLVVWDPVGRRKWELPYPEFADWVTVPDSAAVLCAVDGCDHLDCHGGPFLVVYVGTDEDGVAHACVYSSEACAWSPVTSYLDLAWKMLHIARAILEKNLCIPMEKVLIFCALAEVSMEREEIDYSLRSCFKALAILEHLVEPDHCRIVLLNFYIFLAFTSASKIRDALPYAVKVYSLHKSRMHKLRKASEALLAVKGDNAPAAEVGSEMSSLDNEIEVLTTISTVLGEKLEDPVQEISTPTSKPSGAHNVVYAAPTAASLTLQIAGPSNSMSTTTTIKTPGSTGTDLEIAGQGITQANVKQVSAEPCLKKLAEDSSPIKGDSSNKSDVHPAAREGDAFVSE